MYTSTLPSTHETLALEYVSHACCINSPHQVVDGKIVLAEGVDSAPQMGLDSKKYKLVQSLEKACPNGTPSLAETTKFTVKVSRVVRGWEWGVEGLQEVERERQRD